MKKCVGCSGEMRRTKSLYLVHLQIRSVSEKMIASMISQDSLKCVALMYRPTSKVLHASNIISVDKFIKQINASNDDADSVASQQTIGCRSFPTVY